MKFTEALNNMEACADAVEWVGKRGLKRAWRECDRPDRMLWLLGEMAGRKGWPTKDEIVLLACSFAEDCADNAGKWEPVCRETIAVVRRFVAGEATRDELSAAESARFAAWSARFAAESARFAAESARFAAESAWSAAESAWSAAESARFAAESAWSAQCDVIRDMVSVPYGWRWS